MLAGVVMFEQTMVSYSTAIGSCIGSRPTHNSVEGGGNYLPVRVLFRDAVDCVQTPFD